MLRNISDWIKHFFHVVSNIRPVFWILLYIGLVPVFALIYWWLPDTQFRIPGGAGTDFGSWLYYSIVTITTLGFGDYTPAHGWAQAVTAVEVMCGLVFLGFFLNAVGSMKSEIDVESEIEKQKRAHDELERRKLLLSAPSVVHSLNVFLDYCYAVTTPAADRKGDPGEYNPDFRFPDLADLFKPSGLSGDTTRLPAVSRLISSATHAALGLDSLQQRVDLSLWPGILDESFAFVAACQMFNSADTLKGKPSGVLAEPSPGTETDAEKRLSEEIASTPAVPDPVGAGNLAPVVELYYFIKSTASIALKLENSLTELVSQNDKNDGTR